MSGFTNLKKSNLVFWLVIGIALLVRFSYINGSDSAGEYYLNEAGTRVTSPVSQLANIVVHFVPDETRAYCLGCLGEITYYKGIPGLVVPAGGGWNVECDNTTQEKCIIEIEMV